MKNIFQITLNQIKYEDQDLRDKISGKYLLSFNLIYPRSGVKSIETIKELSLKNKNVFSFKKKPFKDKIIFKEEMQGDVELEVQIALSKEPSKFYNAINRLVKEGLLAGIGLITGGVGVSIATAIAKKTTASIFDNAEKDNKTIVLGKASVLLSDTFTDSNLILNLKVPKAVRVYRDVVIKDGDRLLVDNILVKGYHLADVKLDIKQLATRFPITA